MVVSTEQPQGLESPGSLNEVQGVAAAAATAAEVHIACGAAFKRGGDDDDVRVRPIYALDCIRTRRVFQN